MAASGSRTLKLSILGDVDQLRRSLQTANGDVENSNTKLGDFSRKAGLAFAAAGAAAALYAGKLLIDGVRAAIEDEAAQLRLATSLQNVTGATNTQIKAVEDQILKTSLLTGVTDDELRPSLDRLLRSTKDIEQAQKLQNLALDIAAGSGKSLEAVSNALARGYEGNTAALGRLGIGISAAELKTMSFDQVTAALAETFEGQATIQADTFAGKMARLSVAFSEAKETVGSFVLDAITPLVTNVVNNVIPALSELATNIAETLGPIFADLVIFFEESLLPVFQAFWSFLVDVLIPALIDVFGPALEGIRNAFGVITKAIKDNKDTLKPFFDLIKAIAEFVIRTLAPAFGTTLKLAFEIIGNLISGLITGFALVAQAITTVVDGVRALINLIRNNPLVSGIGDLITTTFGGGRASGGMVSGGTSYMVGENGPELFMPNKSGSIVPNNKLSSLGGTTINLNVSGAIDPESTARAIINVLNNSFYRGTNGAGALVFP